MIPHYQPLIAGVDSPASEPLLNIFNPYDDTLVGKVNTSDESQVERALSTARKCFDDRSQWLKPARRIEILKTLVSLMHEHYEALVTCAITEGGKPWKDSCVEVTRAINGVELCIDGVKQSGGNVIPMGIDLASENKIAFTQIEPIGVVVAVSAFNHPLNLIVHQVAPAIACGCPVIVKPAETTPLTCFKFVELVLQAGLPAQWCQCLIPENKTLIQMLVTDSRVDFFTFIGSAKIGWMLKSQLSAGTHCALEHGGAAPVIVDDHADMSAIVPKLTKGGFYHAGQVCVSVQRVFAHQNCIAKLTQALAESANNLIIGDPLDKDTDVGPLINYEALNRVHKWVTDAVADGAQLVCGGKKISNSLYQPTILLNPPAHSTVSQMEIFGPVICIYEYNDINEAIKQANALPFCFQASVFSENINTALYVSQHLQATTVMINEHTAFRVDWMPFGGLKQSGYGVGGIPYTLNDMQVEKLIVLQTQ